MPVANLDELSALLTELEPMSNRCQIHGKFVGKDKAMATKYKNAYARTNQNFSDQPLHTFIIDVDKYKPGFGDPVEEPDICIQEYIRKVLPLNSRTSASTGSCPAPPGSRATLTS